MAFFSFRPFWSRPSPKARHPQPLFGRIGVEVLEGRSLPSVTSMGAGMHALRPEDGHHGDLRPDHDDAMQVVHPAMNELEAHLTSISGAVGSVEVNAAGKLEIQIAGAAANATVNVTVNGNIVGQLLTNQVGNGTLALPPASVTLVAGATITVGDLSGTFASEANKAAGTNLAALLAGSTRGASGTAELKGNEQEFKLSIKGAAAMTTYNVTFDNVVIGQVTTDQNGQGRLRLSAGTLPAVHTGSTIIIGDLASPVLQGTFA